MSGLVCIRNYYDPEEAFVVRGAMQAAGVDALLFNEWYLGVDPALRIALGGYRLFVPAGAEEGARTALAGIESRSTDFPIGADDACPICGGLSFRRQRSLRWSLIALFVGSPFAAQTSRSRCLSCGEVVGVDRRPILVRLFFFLLSATLLALIIAWIVRNITWWGDILAALR
jgi:hypothetical protein